MWTCMWSIRRDANTTMQTTPTPARPRRSPRQHQRSGQRGLAAPRRGSRAVSCLLQALQRHTGADGAREHSVAGGSDRRPGRESDGGRSGEDSDRDHRGTLTGSFRSIVRALPAGARRGRLRMTAGAAHRARQLSVTPARAGLRAVVFGQHPADDALAISIPKSALQPANHVTSALRRSQWRSRANRHPRA